MFRVGIGFDIHRFKKGRPLWLGGVAIPHQKGLDGHSDADVLLHAITDALLGAAALPDIGVYFPPTSASIKGIDSRIMLAKAVSEITKKGFKVVNVDSVVIGESPKISPYRDVMRATMARLLQIPISSVQVKGKTHEGLDAIGKGQAMSAQAVVLLESRRTIRRR